MITGSQAGGRVTQAGGRVRSFLLPPPFPKRSSPCRVQSGVGALDAYFSLSARQPVIDLDAHAAVCRFCVAFSAIASAARTRTFLITPGPPLFSSPRRFVCVQEALLLACWNSFPVIGESCFPAQQHRLFRNLAPSIGFPFTSGAFFFAWHTLCSRV